MYIKLETQRLDYIWNKQDEICVDLYQEIIDSIELGENWGSKIGKRIVRPTTFIGSPRDMRKRYMDAMTLVQDLENQIYFWLWHVILIGVKLNKNYKYLRTVKIDLT